MALPFSPPKLTRRTAGFLRMERCATPSLRRDKLPMQRRLSPFSDDLMVGWFGMIWIIHQDSAWHSAVDLADSLPARFRAR